MSQKIINAYINYLQEEGKRPQSIPKFCKENKLKEKDFFNEFGSFEAIENQIFMQIFNDIKNQLNSDEVFNGYNSKERVLAFFYSWTEKLLDYRSLILFFESEKQHGPIPHYLKEIKKEITAFLNDIVQIGFDSGEIIRRPFLADYYKDALFIQFIGVHKFWVKDNSKSFEKSDEFIEKSVQFSFDLLGKTAFDSAFDLGKFLFQNINK